MIIQYSLCLPFENNARAEKRNDRNLFKILDVGSLKNSIVSP